MTPAIRASSSREVKDACSQSIVASKEVERPPKREGKRDPATAEMVALSPS
jgi:hypothetical protein